MGGFSSAGVLYDESNGLPMNARRDLSRERLPAAATSGKQRRTISLCKLRHQDPLTGAGDAAIAPPLCLVGSQEVT